MKKLFLLAAVMFATAPLKAQSCGPDSARVVVVRGQVDTLTRACLKVPVDTVKAPPDTVIVRDTVVVHDTVYVPIDTTTPPPPPPPPPVSALPQLGSAEVPRGLPVQDRPVNPTRQTTASTCAEIQPAIDAAAAAPGDDEILIANGLRCTGPIVGKPQAGPQDWTIVRASDKPHVLGDRMTPTKAAASRIPRLDSPQAPSSALIFASNASRYRFENIEFGLADSTTRVTNLVVLGSQGGGFADSTVRDIQLVGIYGHGRPDAITRRCVMLNASHVVIVDFWLDECHDKGSGDSQAIGSFNSKGKIVIRNGYAEGAGENIMFGGSASAGGHNAEDILIEDVHLAKQAAWCAAVPNSPWTIKNLFELKRARRLYMRRVVMDGSCTDGQTGFAIVLKTAFDGSRTSETADVTFDQIIIRNVGAGIAIQGSAGGATDSTTRRITFNRIVIEGLFNLPPWRGANRPIQLINLAGVSDIEFFNTRMVDYQGSPNAAVMVDAPVSGLRFRDFVAKLGTYGFWTSRGTGLAGWTAVSGASGEWTNVTLVGPVPPLAYPPGTTFTQSPSATAGTDLAALRAALAHVEQAR